MHGVGPKTNREISEADVLASYANDRKRNANARGKRKMR